MLEPSKGKTKISGKYRVKQPIENFKIRLKIVQQKSLLAELFENEDEILDTNYLVHEEYEFDWQEKVFGPYEAKFYREERNCRTEKQKEYHRILTEDEDNEGSRLYSYVHGDAYYPDPDLLTHRFRSILSLRNERAVLPLKNRKPFSERYNKKVVDQTPSDGRICENHYFYKEHDNMYIVVDLSSKDAPSDSAESETLLCTINYDPLRKILTVNPDFSADECYSVEGPGMSYDFWIEHISQRPSAREIQRQRDTLKKELQRIRNVKEAQLFHELQAPRPQVLRVFLNLDICSASNFDSSDGLFVSYFVDLPDYWNGLSEGRAGLAGRTQRCRAKNGRANFGYCAEILLDLDLTAFVNDHADGEVAVAKWPNLLLSVASMDSWTRYRIEGYGSLSIPTAPGVYEINLRTWRPACGFVDTLRRFFTGGTRELEDITYSCIPAMHEGQTLDKSCLNIVNSGSLELRLNVVHQSQEFARQRESDSRKLNAGKLMNNVDDVLTQFKEARERMIQARTIYS